MFIHNIYAEFPSCNNERTIKYADTYMPELLHRNIQTGKGPHKISRWYETMKNQTTPLPEKVTGQVKSSQVKSSQVRSGQVRSGQVRSGQVRSGQVRSGQVRTFSFLMKNIVPSGTPVLERKPSEKNRIGA